MYQDTYSSRSSGHEALEHRRPANNLDMHSDDLEVIEVRDQGREIHTYAIRDDIDNRLEEEQQLETSSVRLSFNLDTNQLVG